jgi:hypothetical protein
MNRYVSFTDRGSSLPQTYHRHSCKSVRKRNPESTQFLFECQVYQNRRTPHGFRYSCISARYSCALSDFRTPFGTFGYSTAKTKMSQLYSQCRKMSFLQERIYVRLAEGHEEFVKADRGVYDSNPVIVISLFLCHHYGFFYRS